MGYVSLEGLEFFAYHGYYEEEQKIGNKYQVNIKVETEFAGAAQEDQLSGTVDYERLYKLVETQMAIPSKMLEHLGQRIIDQTIEAFPDIDSVEVDISKFNPPIRGVCERARVTIKKKRS